MNKQKLIRDIIVEALKKDPYILSPPYSRGIKERKEMQAIIAEMQSSLDCRKRCLWSKIRP